MPLMNFFFCANFVFSASCLSKNQGKRQTPSSLHTYIAGLRRKKFQSEKDKQSHPEKKQIANSVGSYREQSLRKLPFFP